MKNDREFTGTLLGFDDFVSKLTCISAWLVMTQIANAVSDMVLEDVIE